MSEPIAGLFEHCKSVFLDYLRTYCNDRFRGTCLGDAVCYALEGGEAKRIRPLLAMLTARSYGVVGNAGLREALAIELVHTYSLIHDDLPCMDDDDIRRGRMSVHKKFSEATALLAGNVLLNDAFRLLSDNKTSPVSALSLINLLTRAVAGMLRGQHLDLNDTHQDNIIDVYRAKTGCLMGFACAAGGVVAEQKPAEVSRLWDLGEKIGIAYQLHDDLVDEHTTVITKSKMEELIVCYKNEVSDKLRELNSQASPLAEYIGVVLS